MKNVIQNNVMIEGFHGRKVSYCGILGCDTVYSGRWVPTVCVYPEDEGRMFLWYVHTQLPDYAMSHEAAPHTAMNTVFHGFTPLSLVNSCCISLLAIISDATYSALSQMQQVPMKCWYLSNKMLSITSQKTVNFIIWWYFRVKFLYKGSDLNTFITLVRLAYIEIKWPVIDAVNLKL